ncbi:MAG: glycosyltransferase family 4 protein [Polyangiaceae bacterium]
MIEEERADVVHFNSGRGVILAGWGAHLARRNTVLHQRGSVATGKIYWLAAQCLTDWILAVARAVIREIYPTMRPRTTVLYNGVNPDLPIVDRAVARAAIARRFEGALALDPDTRLFVSLSSVTPFKGLHYLVEAAALAKKRGVRAAYILAGGTRADTYTAWLRRKIERLGLANEVHLAGFVDDTHQLLCAADALVLPTVAHERLLIDGEVVEEWSGEGLPRSILEAMVAGIPSIASDTAGVSEQIDPGKNGLIVPPGDPTSLAEALVRTAKDDAFRRDAGALAHETARARFSIARAGEGLARELARVAAEPWSLARKMSRWPALARDAARFQREYR